MSILLNVEGTLSTDNSKSHIRYPFRIERDVNVLYIEFSYTPKEETDIDNAKKIIVECLKKYTLDSIEHISGIWQNYLPVTNLLTLSLDDPEKFRGAAHRPSHCQQIYISENEATDGFIPGKIIEGDWLLTLSVHAVVTNECRYNILIWGGEEKHEVLDSL